MAQFVLEEYPEAKIGLLVVDDQYGQEGSAAFLQEIQRNGREAAVTLIHPSGESDPAVWRNVFIEGDIGVVVLFTYVKPAADLLRAALAANYHPHWLGSYVISGPDLLERAGAKAAEGMRATSYPTGPRSHRGERLFLKSMDRLYPGEVPGAHSRIGYAAAQLVVEGLSKAGRDLTRESFIQALESLGDWTGGLLPTVSYSATDHRGLTGLALQRVIRGSWVLERSLLKLKE